MKKTALLAALASVFPLAHATASEAPQAYIDASFVAMDGNHDGRIDKAEYTRFQQARFSRQAESIKAAFAAMDSNGDGRISKAEAAVVPEIAKYFDALDTDHDGFLSLQDLQQAMVAAQTADAAGK